jgi:hypothetical protein
VVVVKFCCIPRLPISSAVKQVASNDTEEDSITCFATDIAKVKRRRLVHIPQCFPYSPSELTWFELGYIFVLLYTYTHDDHCFSTCRFEFEFSSLIADIVVFRANSSIFLSSFEIRDASHKANKQSTYCYCGQNKRRSANNERGSKGSSQQQVVDEPVCPMLVCNRCHQHFHFECVKCIDEPLLVGDDSYNFRCGICNLRSFVYMRNRVCQSV